MEMIQNMEGLVTDHLQNQTTLWNHVFSHIDSMVLKCAVELGIPAIIHKHGGPISLSELSVVLDIAPSKSSQLRRLMRVLTHSGVFSAPCREDDVDEDVYVLTPLSRLFAGEGNTDLSPFVLGMLDPILTNPFHSMAAWFRGGSPTAFSLAHSCGLWEKTNQDLRYNKMFNAAMASDTCFLLDNFVEQNGDIFRGLSTLVDVGGGTGSAARAIAKAFPHVKCSVLDLPHVVEAAPKDGTVNFVSGDMFNFVPPADAVLLKCILHDWDDEDCVKILQRCKDAIPSKEEGGRLIIIDTVVGSKNTHSKLRETQLYYDMLMMVTLNGVEREKHEWSKIFTDAGYTSYKVTPILGLRSVIEVYP